MRRYFFNQPFSQYRQYGQRNRSGVRAEGAFTLIEVMIVIVVIVMLLAISFGVGNAVMETMKTSSTRQLMRTAGTILTDYEDRAETKIYHNSYSPGPIVFDWTIDKSFNVSSPSGSGTLNIEGDADPELAMKIRSIERFVWVTYKIPAIRKGVYGGIDEQFFMDNKDENLGQVVEANGVDNFLELRDAWGNKLIYAAYVYRNEGAILGIDPDGTNRPFDDFLPEHTEPFFASAGPDGEWGNSNELTGTPEEIRQSKDNIYSYQED